MSNTLELDLAEFDDFIGSYSKPVLIDFFADWCGTCRLMAPVIDRIAEIFADRLAVAKVDVERSPMLAARYGIQSIPTIILFVDGQAVEQHVGLLTRQQLQAMLDEHVDFTRKS